MTFQYGLDNLRQIGYQILQEINKMNQTRGLYHLGKLFLSGQEKSELNELEQSFGGLVDPLFNARNAFVNWNAQCDLELSNYKHSQQVKNFEGEKKTVLKLFEKKKPDYAILCSKMQSTLSALEVLERTAVRKDAKKEEIIPQGVVEVITVEKAQSYTALKRIESIFQNAQDYVKIMDKWIGKRTLDFVLEVPSNVPVKILTGFLEKKSERKFPSLLERMQQEKNGSIEVRKCEPSGLHDRFIITNNELWQSGPSQRFGNHKMGDSIKNRKPSN